MDECDTGEPGEDLGLPARGPGSLASWGKRFAALVLDWGVCMAVAVAIFGTAVVAGHDWRSWMTLATYFVEKTVLTALMGGSFGQLFARVAVVRLGGAPIGWWRSVVRAALHCLVLPALVIGPNRRGLDDIVLGTVVVNRV